MFVCNVWLFGGILIVNFIFIVNKMFFFFVDKEKKYFRDYMEVEVMKYD